MTSHASGRPSYPWTPRLPAAPLHAHAERVGTAQAARDWRVSERRVRTIRRQRTVQLRTADELATRMGSHLTLLWPDAP